MIKAIIIEDEPHCRKSLLDALAKTKVGTEIMAQCGTVQEGLDAVRRFQPQLIFLDVEIGKETGFDFLQQVGKLDFEVIFTTAYEGYALKAIKFCALDYLLKPISVDELEQALLKFEDKKMDTSANKKVEELILNLKATQGETKKIALPTSNGLTFIPIRNIIRCEADVNYTLFHLLNKEKLLVSKTLKEFEEMLEEYYFFRVHNTHLINMDHIKKYVKGEGGMVIMDDGSEIDVSRRRKEEFLRRLSAQYR